MFAVLLHGGWDTVIAAILFWLWGATPTMLESGRQEYNCVHVRI
jgi:hypothetical protein